MGKPLADARGGVDAGVGTLRQYAELGPLHRGRSLQGAWDATDLMVPGPRGVVAAITPWNDPVAVPCGIIGAALVTGNTVVLKPSRADPAHRARAGPAAGRGPAARRARGRHRRRVGRARRWPRRPQVDVVAHVGSTAAGRAIAAAAAGTGAKVLLENGGNDPMLVDADVDPEWAAEQAALGAFANAGQICTSVERIYVVEAVAEPFLEALVRRAEALVTGPGTDPATQLGPLVDARMRDGVHAHVDAGGRRGRQAARPAARCPRAPGSFYPATVLTGCTADMAVMQEETFGPVAPVCVVPDFDERARGRRSRAATASPPWCSPPPWSTPSGRGGSCRSARSRSTPPSAARPAAPPSRAARAAPGFGYGPELLDEMTTTKVVHLGAAARLT